MRGDEFLVSDSGPLLTFATVCPTVAVKAALGRFWTPSGGADETNHILFAE